MGKPFPVIGNKKYKDTEVELGSVYSRKSKEAARVRVSQRETKSEE